MLDLFEQGKRFTEELLEENERLRMSLASLKAERIGLEGRLARGEEAALEERIAQLEGEVTALRDENQELREQFVYVEEENREFAERYVQVERQNSDLISLYVASHQLHSTLNYGEVIRVVKEVVINMVGAEQFGIYLLGDESERLYLATHEGLEGMPDTPVAIGEGCIGRAASEGTLQLGEPISGRELTPDLEPIACIPLKVDDKVIGVIAIWGLLLQKEGFGELDHELFELLGNHAATAICAAKVYTLSERKRTTLQGFLDLIKGEGEIGAVAE